MATRQVCGSWRRSLRGAGGRSLCGTGWRRLPRSWGWHVPRAWRRPISRPGWRPLSRARRRPLSGARRRPLSRAGRWALSWAGRWALSWAGRWALRGPVPRALSEHPATKRGSLTGTDRTRDGLGDTSPPQVGLLKSPVPALLPSLGGGAAWLACFYSMDFGVDLCEHLLDVADHRIVGLGHDRRGGIRVDREDVLGCPAPNHVLNRTADSARDVEIRRDPGPGLADLVTVRPPAEAGHRPRAANRAAEQAGELLQRGEAFRTADTSAPADDDARLRERDFSGNGLDLRLKSHAKVLFLQRRRKGISRDLGAAGQRLGRQCVGRERQELDPAREVRFLEQAATPTLPRHGEWITRHDLGAVGGHRQG